METRTIYVRIGTRKEPVEIDGKTTAEDLMRKLGADPERHVVTVNENTLGAKDRILPLLTEGENYVCIVPKAKVGSTTLSNFLTGERRMKQEETLLREMGFIPIGAGIFRGVVKVGRKLVDMDVIFPATFPYARPLVVIHDPSFLGKHPCIVEREYGIEVHFHEEDWKPWMHAADLVVQAASFLERVERGSTVWHSRIPPNLMLGLVELLMSSRRR